MDSALQWIVSAGTSVYEAGQLNEDLFRLRGSLPVAHELIHLAEWGKLKNKDQLERLLPQLRDTTCDAEGLLREFEDEVLRQKMEDTKLRRGQLVSSSVKLFKDLIGGTKARLKEAQSKLDIVVRRTNETLQLIGLNVEPAQLGKQFMPETSSLIGVPRVFGRDEERDQVIERLGVMIGRDDVQEHAIKLLLGVPLTRSARKKATAIGMGAVASTSRAAKRLKGESGRAVSTKTNCSTGHVPVLPIVGIGGVGKTTLAQYIYSAPRVKAHFDEMLWVCVSDIFDKKRITKELIEKVTRQEFRSSGNLDDLQEELKEQLMSRKFLLVLDDVWPIAKNEWEEFFKPFRPELDGSMVMLTTRFPKVAKIVSTVKAIVLKGLPTDKFREFFKECAFGGQNPELYPQL